ncbi:hypothetical protein [Burkholderia glumae]|uniref:hypothetical protein n=1 Tax=Burkholderia glumae TaxID=337 RepID=UPI00215041A2|nr:hypothetical protein [Burkholderia glumae]
MSAVPSGHARDRRSRFGLRAVVAIQRRFKRQLVVLLLLARERLYGVGKAGALGR